MSKYCRAYRLRDLRQFSDWIETYEGNNNQELSDDDVCYLWNDFTVVRSPIQSKETVIFDIVTPEWEEFCKTTLRFEIPEDLRYA